MGLHDRAYDWFPRVDVVNTANNWLFGLSHVAKSRTVISSFVIFDRIDCACRNVQSSLGNPRSLEVHRHNPFTSDSGELEPSLGISLHNGSSDSYSIVGELLFARFCIF